MNKEETKKNSDLLKINFENKHSYILSMGRRLKKFPKKINFGKSLRNRIHREFKIKIENLTLNCY